MDPQSFNRYTYVRNDPLNYVDPTGHQAQKPRDPQKDIENPDCTECDILYAQTQAPKKTPFIISSVVEAPPQFIYEFRYPLGVPRTTPAPTAGGGGGGLRFLGGLAGAGALILANPVTAGGGDTCSNAGPCGCYTICQPSTQTDTSANPKSEDNKPDTGDRTKDDQDIRLYRFGWSVESRARLARKFADSEQPLRDELDRAKTSAERDELYFKLALLALNKEDLKARNYVQKIDDGDFRKRAQAYVDWGLAKAAVKKKEVEKAWTLLAREN